MLSWIQFSGFSIKELERAHLNSCLPSLGLQDLSPPSRLGIRVQLAAYGLEDLRGVRRGIAIASKWSALRGAIRFHSAEIMWRSFQQRFPRLLCITGS